MTSPDDYKPFGENPDVADEEKEELSSEPTVTEESFFSFDENDAEYFSDGEKQEIIFKIEVPEPHEIQVKKKKSDGLSITAFVLGLITMAACFNLLGDAIYVSIGTGVASVILGAMSLKKNGKNVFALLGLIFGAVGLFLSVVLFILGIIFAEYFDAILDWLFGYGEDNPSEPGFPERDQMIISAAVNYVRALFS